MAHRRTATSSPPARRRDAPQRRPPRRILALLLGAAFVIPFAILFLLIALEVRLGEGYFAYRYSPVRGMRTVRALAGVALALPACAAVWMLATARWRKGGLTVLAGTFVLAGLWAWWAPPYPMNQHMFALTSPSSDGAFVIESHVRVESLRAYLRSFESLLKTPVDIMGGTRVLSNPPGMTILTHVVHRHLPGQVAMERYLVEHREVGVDGAGPLALALRMSAALAALWAVSGMIAYALGRVFLLPAGAAVFAIIVTFNPCAVSFVPGKDPAQLVIINAMLWAWFAATKHVGPAGRTFSSRDMLAALGGAILVIGATFSLVHIWVALIALSATLWHHPRGTLKPIIAAAIGAIAVVALAYFAVGWNIPSTLLAVSRRWNELQKTFEMNRAIWYAIGLPIFLLFLSPAIFALAGLSLRRRRLNSGTKLALVTAAAMLFIYFGLGMTYELPRLWLAFLPPLVLGLCIDRPLLRGSPATCRPRVAHALMLIVLAQIVFTALHWTLFDVREAEYRLITQRYYG